MCTAEGKCIVDSTLRNVLPDVYERVEYTPRGMIVTKNNELERRIDVWSQTSSTPPVVKLSFKVETMTFKEDETTINHSAFYREFTEVYSRLMEKDADMALEKELEILCEKYTEVFRANLTDRFPGIEFCDSIEESSDTWYSLRDHIQDPRVLPIVSNMLLMADVLSGTTDFQNRRLCINNPIV